MPLSAQSSYEYEPGYEFNRNFSNLGLSPTAKGSKSKATNKKTNCLVSTGLYDVNIEVLAKHLDDSIFRDFFNVYLLLPLHTHRCTIKQNNEGLLFEVFPLERGSGFRLCTDRMLRWLYSNRLPFYLKSRLYQLAVFTHEFCDGNTYLTFDEKIEYTKKELNMVSDLRTVEGVQKLIRHAGSTPDGAAIQIWLDLQALRHTDKDSGYADMMKAIGSRYLVKTNNLYDYFKKMLEDTIKNLTKASHTSYLINRKNTIAGNLTILRISPFLQTEESKQKDLDNENIATHDPIRDLQTAVMQSLKQDFCRRYLSYYSCLPKEHLNTFPSPGTDHASISPIGGGQNEERCPLESGKQKKEN